MLTAGEELRYIAVQKKPVVTLAPDCVVLTTKRFIVYRVSVLGSATFIDIIWRDLHGVWLTEGLLGATLVWQALDGRRGRVEYLPKTQARRVYAFAQQMEEAMREERRDRDLEQRRASAGGVDVQAPAPAESTNADPAPSLPSDDAAARLAKLKQVFEAGLITAEEYERKESEVLSSM